MLEQHGVATALACALLDLKCKFYMGAKDVHAKAQMYLEWS